MPGGTFVASELNVLEEMLLGIQVLTLGLMVVIGSKIVEHTDFGYAQTAILILGQNTCEAKSVLSYFSMQSISRFAENVYLRKIRTF